MRSLSIFGTSSDAGKSTLSFALTYLLKQYGINAAPFKAQNVSNNSVVTDINPGEIAIPQAFAAKAIGLKTSPLMNPILLKSGGKNKAHMIVNGQAVSNTDVQTYYRDLDTLKPIVKKAFKTLNKEYECIVAEGAGSPVELNLMDKDLSNIFIAKEFDTKIILVADIERGGVFASIYGVYNLLPKKLKKNVIGVIVNKFRGDISLFDEGVRIIKEEFGIPVLGVVPYRAFNLGFEDSASLLNYKQNLQNAIIKVGVISLPHISNFTDFEPLVIDPQIELNFISSAAQASNYDLLILPGSKRVVDDLLWLRKNGFEEILQDENKKIIAICGGYEMMHEYIQDPKKVESKIEMVAGFGRFKGTVTFEKQKVLKNGTYKIYGVMGNGYEIHNGIAKKNAKKKNNLYGTFLHGIFDNDNVRDAIFSELNPAYEGYDFNRYKALAIAGFAHHVKEHVDIDTIVNALYV
ncbi:MAG: cobyric acid synthase [Campylobacterales bacterium]|nr:cobyric acid synthase [Campylobacterales bacterium]